jgi:hypothetical protein
MKKAMVVTILLLGVASVAAPLHSAQQEIGHEIKQKISKKAGMVAAHADVRYNGSPRFASIAETTIFYATNTPDEVINIGDVFYVNLQGVWLSSPNAQGPWIAARYVPEAVPAIICSQLNAYPLNPYQLCALPWSSGLSYTVWEPF